MLTSRSNLVTVSLSRRLWRRLTGSRTGCCCCRRLSARDWNTRGRASVPIAQITDYTKQGLFLNRIKIKQMWQMMELGLLWLLSVSPPSAVSRSHLNVESQKHAEISRGDLEDKAQGKQQSHKTVSVIMLQTVSSLKYGLCDWSAFLFHLVVVILLNYLSN